MPEGYLSLQKALNAALDQAINGKGRERHGSDLSFDEQPMLAISRVVGIGFPLGQVCKKVQEAARLVARDEPDRARAELLGAINYLAGAVVLLEEMSK